MKLTWIKNTSPALISCASSIGACVSLAVVFSQVDISGGAPRPTSGPRPAAAEPYKIGYEPPPIRPELVRLCLQRGAIGPDVRCS